MPPHGCARLRRRPGTDGAEDLPVLLLEGPQVGAVVRHVGRVHANGLAGNDGTAEIFQEPWELRISRGLGDTDMEGEVLVDRRLAALDCEIDGLICMHDL